MRFWALVGPTASGKTRIALDVAPALRAEIVSLDSMQVYRGMDVGTAKPSPEELARVPHHLIDVVDLGAPFSVAEFQRRASDAIAGINTRGRTPLLVGGSGLYFRAVVDDLEFPPTDAQIRDRIDQGPTDDLLRRLDERDPEAAARTQGNRRRIVRALEVIEITGKAFSSFRTAWDRYPRAHVRAAGLAVPSDLLAARISERAHAMLSGPLQEEAVRLAAAGFRDALESAPAIGYREALAVSEGTMPVDEAIAGIVRQTRGLARRQMSWFRRDPRIVWFDGSDLDGAGAAVTAYWTSEATEKAVGGS